MSVCTVSGILLDSGGTAIGSATVRFNLSAPLFDASSNSMVPREVTTTTDASGAWSLALVQETSGTITLEFRPSASSPIIEQAFTVIMPASLTASFESVCVDSSQFGGQTVVTPDVTLSVSTLDSDTPSSKGLSFSGFILNPQSASTSNPGFVNNTTQSFSGNKTFTGTITATNFSGTNTGDVTLTAVGSTPSANGASLSGQVLTLQPASATLPGLITAGTQSFGGAKTFASTITASNFSGSSSGTQSGTNTGDISFAPVGTTPTSGGASISGQVVTLQPADGSTPGLLTALTQTIGGNKTFTGSISASNLSGSSSGANTGDLTLVAVGSTPSANGASLSGQVLTLQPASSTLPGLVKATSQAFGGAKQIVGNADAVQLRVTGNSSQSNDIFLVENSAGSPIFEVNNSGNATVAGAWVGTFAANAAGSVSNASYTFSSNFDTGLYLPAGGTLGITAGGVQTFKSTSTAITLPLLTASKLVATDASKVLTSVTSLASYITAPTIQKFTSSTGTYTTPAGVLYIKVRLIGAGGGGSGSGATSGNGGTGGDSTFGSSFLTASGGAGGNASTLAGGAGGAVTVSAGTAIIALAGGAGNASADLVQGISGSGASSYMGGGGAAPTLGVAGGNGVTNSGAGGGGGGANVTVIGGAGGGAGGYIEIIIASPSATYSYAVGAAGAAGTAGTSGFAGGAGGSGVVVVEEYYQ